MITAVETIVKESRRLGYRDDAILRDYTFSDLGAASATSTRRAPLAVFTQTPPSYRSAAFGAAVSGELGAEATVRKYRALGAPLFFVIEDNQVSVWQVYAGGPPRELQRTSLDALVELFRDHREVWAPEAIHRAKSIGRFDPKYQLDFVDVGLIPAIEGEIHEKLDRLLQETLAATREASDDLTARALFRGVFRLLAAKILIDRGHQASRRWKATDVASVLSGIGDYYDLPDVAFDAQAIAPDLEAAWRILVEGLNVANISAADLAFAYENTLVTPETRRAFGTHSTPRHVAEYIVERIGFRRYGEHPPRVFEPFAGAGVFLVSALRHMRETLPSSWTDQKRHDLLVRKVHGSEIDAFACEVATLSLILADYPNKNGWRIENTDLFRDGALAERLAASDVVLCNPPFEIFTPKERVNYPEAAARSGSKVVAVLSAALEVRPKALGFVLPRAFLLDRAYRDHRREIERLYREVELVSLPDGVFTVSQIESALLIARDLAEPGDSQRVLASEVDDSDRRKFAFTGLPSRTREEVRPFPSSGEEQLWIPPLRPLWRRLRSAPKLGDYLTGHWGLRWVEGGQSKAVVDGPGANRALGVMHSRGRRQFALGDPEWIDVNPDRLYAGGSLSWGEPKILCNAGRRSRGNWRLTAAVDRNGLVASQQFVGLWEREGRDEVDLDALAAVLNGPLANAYMAEHSTEKRLRIATLLSIPMPQMLPKNVGELAREYAQAIASAPGGILEDHRLAALLNEMDCTILDAYDLPPRMVRALLASFEGSVRQVAHEWRPWCVSISDPALTLTELRSGMLDHARSDWIRRKLKPVSGDEAAKAAPYLP